MDTALAIWAWLLANADSILAALFAIEVVAVSIVNLTPTEVDNKILAKVHAALVWVANIVPNAKVTPKG